MGMSASQARLLSITARLTNNEFRSQTITNSKLRLASESEVASTKYMDALSTKQLMFMSYDDNGDANKIALTANTLLMYGDLKNQYALVNNSGKILLNNLDIKNYESSETMNDFMYKYGIEEVENPEYTNTLQEIFGNKYADIFELKDNLYNWVMDNAGDFLPYVYNLDEFKNLDILNLSKSDYNTLRDTFVGNLSDAGIDNSLEDKLYGNNIFTNMIVNLLNCPEYVEKPNLFEYAQQLLSPQCWNETGINNSIAQGYGKALNNNEIWHVEHVLAQYLWSSKTGSMTVNVNGTDETITNGSSSMWGMTSGGGNGDDPCKVRDVLAKPENQDLKTKLQQLYYEVCLHIETNRTQNGFNSGDSITNNGGNSPKSGLDIGTKYYDLIKELLEAVAEDIIQAKDERYNNNSGLQEYDTKFNEFVKFYQNYNVWIDNTKTLINGFIEALNNIPEKLIPDEKDSKYQWYKNLWYRMGSTDEKNKGSCDNYLAIDDNLLNSDEWLQFAFEHGILTLERAEFVEQGSDIYTKMGTYDWIAMPYQNAGDFVEVDNEKAIAIAEAKYKKTMREIENKDNKYDQDLKKLDTEHTALQTEYDSIKEVISKNVDRSFKAFS